MRAGLFALLVSLCSASLLLEKQLNFTAEPLRLSVTSSLNTSRISAGLQSVCLEATALGLNLRSTQDSASCTAFAVFKEQIQTSGWNRLSVRFQDSVLSHYAAGLAEGLVSGRVISVHIKTVREVYSYGDLRSLYAYFRTQDKEMVEALASPAKHGENKYWEWIRGLRAQLEGVRDGTSIATGKTVRMEDIYLLNSDGDIDNLFLIADSKRKSKPLRRLNKPGRCSALVKIVEDEVYFAHTTMEDYREMNRVLKSYSAPSGSVVMSSYPGAISSTDDFLLSSHGLAMMETSLEVADEDVMFRQTDSLPAFIRVQAAIRHSPNPSHLITTLLKYDSHSYASQWMILDYNRTAKRPLTKAFYVLETAPRYSKSKDLSKVLERQSFWSSFNWPYFNSTLLALGFPSNTPSGDYRDPLFSRLQASISSLEDMQRVMQYNSWQENDCDEKDILSPCEPWQAISPRFDLANEKDWFGGTDSKVTSRALMEIQGFMAISGPTHQSQPVFQFPPSWKGYIPRVWDFAWVYFAPSL